MAKKRYADSALGSATFAKAVTPNDNADIDTATTRALYVGTGGDLVVTMADEQAADVTFRNVPDGMLLDLGVARVKSASTAADIVALF